MKLSQDGIPLETSNWLLCSEGRVPAIGIDLARDFF